MKTITLTQPWASAVALGVKRVETRSWSTNYRGQIAIHAAKGFPKYAKEFASEVWQEGGNWIVGMPLGCVVAVAELVAILPTSGMTVDYLLNEEKKWGDYSQGRFAWFLENVRALPEPIPAKGALGLWEWSR